MNSKGANKNISRDEIRTAILSIVPSIADWARNHKFSRAVVHQSINGHGSREIRGHLAVLIHKKPSEIWPNRSKKLNLRDDERYNELISINHSNDSSNSIPDHLIRYLSSPFINLIPTWKPLNDGEICTHEGSYLGMVLYRDRGWDAVRVRDDLSGGYMLEILINLHEIVVKSSTTARQWVESGRQTIQRIG